MNLENDVPSNPFLNYLPLAPLYFPNGLVLIEFEFHSIFLFHDFTNKFEKLI